MDIYRTPETRFEHLPDYAFEPHYREVDGLRVHYVDVNAREVPTILLLHGEPTWSYLYRHMIPILSRTGQRVVAPDLIGFGKSDKPTRLEDYSYRRHVDWLKELVRRLELRHITLFCQDWGALIGLRVAAEEPDRFDRIAVGNGALPRSGRHPGVGIVNAAAFLAWRTFAQFTPRFPAGRIVDFGCKRMLSADERRAYDAPFPVDEAQAGARAFPRLVPLLPSDPELRECQTAWESLSRWEKPFLTTFSDGDPITRGFERVFQSRVPGARNQPHWTPHGGHFLQEDVGPELAQRIEEWIEATPIQRRSPPQVVGPRA